MVIGKQKPKKGSSKMGVSSPPKNIHPKWISHSDGTHQSRVPPPSGGRGDDECVPEWFFLYDLFNYSEFMCMYVFIDVVDSRMI